MHVRLSCILASCNACPSVASPQYLPDFIVECVCVSESSSRAQACVFAKPATKHMLVSHCAVHREAVHGRPPCQQAAVPPCHQGAASLSYIRTALCEMDTFLRGVCILLHLCCNTRPQLNVCVCAKTGPAWGLGPEWFGCNF